QQTCHSCGGIGHMGRNCPQTMKCYNCGKSGHISRDCPEAQG
ncbi:DNA-binding protein HEXBP, partial [Aspergillus lentulus]